jgi:DNA-directed RNA polymerase subunit D
MDIKVLGKGNKPVQWVKFVMSGKEVNPTFANTLRRILRVEVPCLAIEDLIIKKNSSILYDEMLGLRLGLIPITTPSNYVLPEVCGCGSHCPKCSVSLILKKKGPGWVYSKDFKSQDPKAKPVFPNMPIVYLTEWQELEMEAITQMGVAKNHVKWQCTLPGYQMYPEIKLKKGVTKEGLSVCPRGVFDLKTLKLKNLENCNLCMACVRNSPKGVIEVKALDDKYIFYVESFGQLSLKDALVRAAEVLQGKAKAFAKLLTEKPKKKKKK